MIRIRCVYAFFYLYQNSTGLISVFGVFAFSAQLLPQMHWHLLSFDLFYQNLHKNSRIRICSLQSVHSFFSFFFKFHGV